MNSSSPNEEARLAALHRLNVLDTPAEQVYDDIVQLASQICGVPVAAMSFVDRDRQWFKSKKGMEADQTPRDISFCTHTVAQVDLTRIFQVPDATLDSRFNSSPLVTA